MRWQRLFDDLEAQVEAADRADFEAELRDRARAEQGRLRLVDRLRAARGRTLDVHVRDGGRERGALVRVGPDWLLVEPEPGRETLIPLASAVVIAGADRTAAEPGSEGLVAARLDLRHVLRAIVRDRSRVAVGVEGGGSLSGVLLRVGADHVELAEEVRSSAVLLVPLTSLLLVRRLADVVS